MNKIEQAGGKELLGSVEKQELIGSIVDEYTEKIMPAIDTHMQNADAVRNNDGDRDDSLKRSSLLALVAALTSLDNKVMIKIGELEGRLGENLTLNTIHGKLYHSIDLLNKAPDARYNEDRMTDVHGGKKENIPAGKTYYVWETTRESLISLGSFMSGIKETLKFLG